MVRDISSKSGDLVNRSQMSCMLVSSSSFLEVLIISSRSSRAGPWVAGTSRRRLSTFSLSVVGWMMLTCWGEAVEKKVSAMAKKVSTRFCGLVSSWNAANISQASRFSREYSLLAYTLKYRRASALVRMAGRGNALGSEKALSPCLEVPLLDREGISESLSESLQSSPCAPEASGLLPPRQANIPRCFLGLRSDRGLLEEADTGGGAIVDMMSSRSNPSPPAPAADPIGLEWFLNAGRSRAPPSLMLSSSFVAAIFSFFFFFAFSSNFSKRKKRQRKKGREIEREREKNQMRSIQSAEVAFVVLVCFYSTLVHRQTLEATNRTGFLRSDQANADQLSVKE